LLPVALKMAFSLPTQAHAYLDARWDAHLERTREFLRQPSISAQNVGVRAAADLLCLWLKEREARIELYGRETHPVIYAEWNVGAPKTLLIYGMYDVQPVDDQKWTTPPFAAEIWNHPDGGESIVARGACNSKGPLMAFLHAIEALLATGGLPINIKWTIEGEEEIGSMTLYEFYREQRERLAADAAFEPFWSQWTLDGEPNITLGVKGVMGLEFICRAGDWGGPSEVVHSSLGPWVASPAWRLVQALNTLVDQNQELQVEGIPALGAVSEDDEKLLRELALSFDSEETRAQMGIARFKRDLPPFELLRQIEFAPALNINGLKSGYLGEGAHTIIPTEARALCDLRLAPGMKVKETYQAIKAHLARHGFADIDVVMDSGYPAAHTPFSAPVVQALVAAYRAHGHQPTLRPMEASATPYYLYTDILGLDVVWGGLGTAGGSHGPNEWCSVPGLKAMEKSLTTFLVSFAESS
jgi:acetylornithine deacetylase/succinyl-diaminopimelate desuccinylase-like protein